MTVVGLFEMARAAFPSIVARFLSETALACGRLGRCRRPSSLSALDLLG